MHKKFQSKLVTAFVVLTAAALAAAGTALAGSRSATSGSAGIDRSDATTFMLFGVFDPSVGGEEGEEGEFEEPTPGETFVFADDLFAADTSDPADPRPMGDRLGRTLGKCTLISFDLESEDGEILCEVVARLDGKGDLTFQAGIRFSEFGQPDGVRVAITGGSGLYAGAGGEIIVTDVPIAGDDENTNSLYEVRL